MSWLTRPKRVAAEYRGDHGRVPDELRTTKKFIGSYSRGLWLDPPPILLPDGFVTYLSGMRIVSSKIVFSPDYPIYSEQPIAADHHPLGMVEYLRDDLAHRLLVFSGTRAYVWNSSTTDLDVLRNPYATGTVAVSNANPAVVTGVGTTFVTNQVKPGDLFKIAADADANYRIVGTVDSETQITLTTTYPGAPIGAGAAYTIDRLHHGDTYTLFSSIVLEGTTLWSQGEDVIRQYNGTSIINLTNTYAAKYLSANEGRLVLAHTTETGSIVPRRVRWTVRGDITDFSGIGAGFTDLIDTPDVITNIKDLQGQVVVYKERNIYLGQLTGNVYLPYYFSRKVTGIGLLAPHSLATDGERHFFVGTDDIYAFDGVTLESLTQESMSKPLGSAQRRGISRLRRSFFEALNRNRLSVVFGFADTERKEYTILTASPDIDYPDTAWVYNWEEDTWAQEHYSTGYAPRCFTTWKSTTFTAIDDVTTTIDSTTASFDSFTVSSGQRFTLQAFSVLSGSGLGKTVGFNVHRLDAATTDYVNNIPGSTESSGYIILPETHLGVPGVWKTLTQLRFRYRTYAVVSMEVGITPSGSSETIAIEVLPNTEGIWKNSIVNVWLHGEAFMVRLTASRLDNSRLALGTDFEYEFVIRGDVQGV